MCLDYGLFQYRLKLLNDNICRPLHIGPSSPGEISYEFNSICDTEDTNKASITIQWNNTNS